MTGALGLAWVGCMWGYLTMAAATKASVAGATLFLAHSGIGAVFLWMAIDRIPDALRKVLDPFCLYVFPIYLLHMGVLALVRSVVQSLFRGSWTKKLGRSHGDRSSLRLRVILTGSEHRDRVPILRRALVRRPRRDTARSRPNGKSSPSAVTCSPGRRRSGVPKFPGIGADLSFP